MEEWLQKPEWEYLLDLMLETTEEAVSALLNADPSNPAAIASAQQEVRYLGHFTDGDVARAMVEELKGRKDHEVIR